MMRRLVVAFALLSMLLAPLAGLGQPLGAAVASLHDQIYVFGREVRFEHLGSSRGEPVVRVDDAGLGDMLSLVGARQQFQPGTRFIVITRADGTLITFTVGSNAVSVDDRSTAIPFGPFYENNQLYAPLLPIVRALGLSTRRFHGGFAFAPQIVSVQRHIGQRRTVIEVQATAPLAWRTEYGGAPHHQTLTITFPGFANAAGAKVALGGREAKAASISQQGPPGYPITSMTIDVMHGVRFASHRAGGVSTMDLILARNQSDLALAAVTAKPSVQISTPPKPAATPVPTQAPTQAPQPVASSNAPVPTAVPAPEVTDNSGASATSASPSPQPSGFMPQPEASPSPLQKIMDVEVTDAPGASRITLALTGPVSFEWHRLAPPDNRFWIDISQVALVGPARDVTVKLASVRSVRVSQHELDPDHVVRVSIDPAQPVDVVIGGIEGAPNQLGIEIRDNPPPQDAPSSGVGILTPPASPSPQPAVAVTRGPSHPNLIVIDAGHGGNDPGAENRQYGLIESHLTLSIVQRLKADLEHAGWRVTLTRDGDYEVGDPNGNDKQELQARCDVANAAGARLFISVHINSSFSSGPSGVTTYYWRQDDRPFAQDVQGAAVASSGIGDAGVRRENFYVIHHTFMPAVLVEVAYLSNSHDAALLAQPAFLDKVAAGIAQGVKGYTGGAPTP
jgi:N-acetylmuramoyl-L-alanine amidase